MRKRFISMLVLLVAVATGAMAQETYKVSVKEGTEDATSWTIAPAEATTTGVAAGTTVTATYSGTKKVKSVKAVKKAAKPDLLPAVFTVDAGKTVKFSKGNLQATYNGSSWIWGFAEHQWDYIGNAAGNTSINGNGTVSANGTVDLFGWVGASSTWTGAAQYGISNSTATNNVDGYGNVGGEAQKVGWGATVGTGWRTLTRPEWLYLLSTRETGITVNSTDNARYTLAIINTDGTAVKGLIIFPDSYAGGSPAGVTWGTINAKSTFETTCTSAGWTALEAAGCVFLPAAGYREASNVTDAGIGAGYWSSSSSNAPYAFALYFESNYMTIQYGGSRKYGFSVRLVQAVAAEPAGTDLSTINADYTASDGETLTGTLGKKVKISIADGATVTLGGVDINASGTFDYGYCAGITCLGDATIILKDGTTNSVLALDYGYPGIYVPVGHTLTIQGETLGTGILNATGRGSVAGAGIGAASESKNTYRSCGNIVIAGGVINATGGSERAAGIGCGGSSNPGSATPSTCGTITITGGTITATGSKWAPGIGGGFDGDCGDITIANTVTSVTATKGAESYSSLFDCIGRGRDGACGTVKFGTQTMYNGSSWTTTPTSGSTYGGLNLTISQTTYANDTWTLTPAP